MSKFHDDFEKLSLESNERDYSYNIDELHDNEEETLKMLLNEISSILLIYNIKDAHLKLNKGEKLLLSKKINKILSKSFETQVFIEQKLLKEILNSNVISNYYRQVYILSLGDKSVQVKKLSESIISEIINESVEGKMWKDRILNNKKSMKTILKKDIRKFLNGDISVNHIEQIIKSRFRTNSYVSKRLIETEIARCQSRINEHFAKEYGIENQVFRATLDNRTTETCRSYDGMRFKTNDVNKPIPPLHILCRSCLVNIPNGNWKLNAYRWDFDTWYENNIGGKL
ncbi:minor capsid protein [Romboutsia sp. 1001285H_161024_C4]|uniref:minor capsid protein n=1 Tax=Romboutsia sp. 1001285H_161024_C4 TaxID=2787109 RepID=UPI00189B4B26|nr:minor capsid protein [Romboutsia sp. 1001285H_161024_C4]